LGNFGVFGLSFLAKADLGRGFYYYLRFILAYQKRLFIHSSSDELEENAQEYGSRLGRKIKKFQI